MVKGVATSDRPPFTARCHVRKLSHRFAFALMSLGALTGCTSTPSQPANNTTASTSSWSWMNPFAAKPANTIASPAASGLPENDQLSLSKKPRSGSDLYLHTAKVYEQSNNFDAAKSQYEKALEIEPRNYDVLLAYAHMQDRAGKFDDAAKLYQRAIAAQPKQPTAYNDLGLCLARVNRYDESVRNLNKAIEMQPQKALYRNNLATVLVQQNKLQEAVTQLSAVNPPAVAHYNVAFLLQRRGDMNAATQHMITAAQLDPNLSAARQWLQENQPTSLAQSGPAIMAPQSQPQSQNSYSMAQAPSYTVQAPSYSAQPPVAQQLQYQQPQPGYQVPTQYAPPSYNAPQNSQPTPQYRPVRGQDNAPTPYPGFTPSARTRALNNQIQQASYEDAIEELSSEIPPMTSPTQPTPRF
jgi:Flp pilus assembly protein TadD